MLCVYIFKLSVLGIQIFIWRCVSAFISEKNSLLFYRLIPFIFSYIFFSFLLILYFGIFYNLPIILKFLKMELIFLTSSVLFHSLTVLYAPIPILCRWCFFKYKANFNDFLKSYLLLFEILIFRRLISSITVSLSQ